jgi:hypothetical protein
MTKLADANCLINLGYISLNFTMPIKSFKEYKDVFEVVDKLVSDVFLLMIY